MPARPRLACSRPPHRGTLFLDEVGLSPEGLQGEVAEGAGGVDGAAAGEHPDPVDGGGPRRRPLADRWQCVSRCGQSGQGEGHLVSAGASTPKSSMSAWRWRPRCWTRQRNFGKNPGRRSLTASSLQRSMVGVSRPREVVARSCPGGSRMERITGPAGTTISYDRYGSGPPLVLVHGGFSDHVTNWQEVNPCSRTASPSTRSLAGGEARLAGPGDTRSRMRPRTSSPCIQAVGQPVFLLGYSYGASAPLERWRSTRTAPQSSSCMSLRIPRIGAGASWPVLEQFAESEDWDAMVEAFMRDVVQVPPPKSWTSGTRPSGGSGRLTPRPL